MTTCRSTTLTMALLAAAFAASANPSPEADALTQRLVACEGTPADMAAFAKFDNGGKGQIRRLNQAEESKFNAVPGFLARAGRPLTVAGATTQIFWAGGPGAGITDYGLVFVSPNIVQDVRDLAARLQMAKRHDDTTQQVYVKYPSKDRAMVLWNSAWAGEQLGKGARSRQYTLNCFYGVEKVAQMRKTLG